MLRLCVCVCLGFYVLNIGPYLYKCARKRNTKWDDEYAVSVSVFVFLLVLMFVFAMFAVN